MAEAEQIAVRMEVYKIADMQRYRSVARLACDVELKKIKKYSSFVYLQGYHFYASCVEISISGTDGKYTDTYRNSIPVSITSAGSVVCYF